MTKNKNYVNNKEFTKAVTEYAKQYREAESKGKTPPVMSEYIGECILKMSRNLATKRNFSNYSYIDEMQEDAIEDVMKYIKNFNPEKSDLPPNAFAYVSQIMYRAFVRRLTKEAKQQEITQSLIYNAGIIDEFVNSQDHDNDSYLYIADNIKSYADDYYKMDASSEEDAKVNTEANMDKKQKTYKERGFDHYLIDT